jgi:hypothetical protein
LSTTISISNYNATVSARVLKASPVVEARLRLEREIRALFPSGRYWDDVTLVRTVAAIRRNDPRLRRYTLEAIEG